MLSFLMKSRILEENKAGTSKVGAISKAQKAQSFLNCERGDPLCFLKKKRKIRILSQSHSAEKLEREDPSDFLKLQFAEKIKKLEGGFLWRQKNSKKSRTVSKKLKP